MRHTVYTRIRQIQHLLGLLATSALFVAMLSIGVLLA